MPVRPSPAVTETGKIVIGQSFIQGRDVVFYGGGGGGGGGCCMKPFINDTLKTAHEYSCYGI